MSGAYYNEIDEYAAQWLRNLISAGHIAPGDVDTRSIEDVKPDDLRGYTQCHFFAGIGVWSHALRLAGWPDDRRVWTGSCPCQPFSAAGAGGGFADERHLWPAWFHLISQCRPDVVFGEQVEAAIRHGWLDLVQTDMEGLDYAFGAAGIPAAGVGAPHIRARLWFVAHSDDARLEGRGGVQQRPGERASGSDGVAGGLADADGSGRSIERVGELLDGERQALGHDLDGCGPLAGFWQDADWLFCRDGKWRPVEPGTFPLAHGASARVGRLRAYGNAIDAQAAAEWVGAYLACKP